MQQLAPETKIKIDNFINEVLTDDNFCDESEDFEIKPSLIAEYLEINRFEECDSDFEDDYVYKVFSKENPNYNSETDEDEQKYFYIRLVINHMESTCCLDTEY